MNDQHLSSSEISAEEVTAPVAPAGAGSPSESPVPANGEEVAPGAPGDRHTTDEITLPPTVGEVEVVEPEARRVPHPPAYVQHGGGSTHSTGDLSPAARPVVEQLSDLIAARAATPRKGSYTNALLADPIKAQRKMMEEAFETCLELHTPTALVDHDAVAAEAADLVFHLLVALRTQGVGWAEVEAKLVDRLGKPARHSTY